MDVEAWDNVEGRWKPRVPRGTAMLREATRYFTGKPCKWGHVTERYVSSHQCVECARLAVLHRYHNDPDYRAREIDRRCRDQRPAQQEQKRNRYHSDPEERERAKERVRRHRARKRNQRNQEEN